MKSQRLVAIISQKNRVEQSKTTINSKITQTKEEVVVEPKQEPKINRTKISIPNNEDDLELPSYLRLGQGRK